MPSEALFDHPEDARFYDWHLKDPKDKPFTIFKFHYRSWESLESLQLIPQDYPRIMLPPSASLLSLVGLPREVQVSEREFELESASPIISSEPSVASITPWLTSVFDEPPASAEQHQKREEVSPAAMNPYALRCPIPISKFAVSAEVDSIYFPMLCKGNNARIVLGQVMINSP